MKTTCPDSTKKEAPILGRDFIYNLYTFLISILKTKAVGPANVFYLTTQGPVEAFCVSNHQGGGHE